MKSLLDTTFLIWIVTDAPQLDRYPWLSRYAPWTISPVCLLEVQYLMEAGRLRVEAGFADTVSRDPRFVLDDLGLVALGRAATPLGWTRDPFDRLICAHSNARRLALSTTDPIIIRHHRFLVDELH